VIRQRVADMLSIARRISLWNCDIVDRSSYLAVGAFN
jgi:hypothetical protein